MSLGARLAVVFTVGWVPVFLVRTERFLDAAPVLTAAERFASVVSVASMAIHISLGCNRLVAEGTSVVPALASLVVYASGLGLWFWGRAQISSVWVKRMPQEPPLRLRRDGAFGIVRHPLYGGMLLAALALPIATGVWWQLLTYAACVAAVVTRLLQEERRLFEQMGDEYRDYAASVSRLIPGIW